VTRMDTAVMTQSTRHRHCAKHTRRTDLTAPVICVCLFASRRMSRGVSNGAIAGVLGLFCASAYVYTMRAVGQDELDVALAQRETAETGAKDSKAAAAGSQGSAAGGKASRT
jgi:hypothetical protein